MSGDDTQDANSEPGDPEINLEASGLPGMSSPTPPSRTDWLDLDGLHEICSTRPNNERRLQAERLERIVLALQTLPNKLGAVEKMLGLDWDDRGI